MRNMTQKQKMSMYREDVLDWLLNTITDPFYTHLSTLEKELLIANETPDGFMYKNMVFGNDVSLLAFACKPELEAKAYELWELKQKVKRDYMYLENYFRKVLSRMTNWGQLYCYVPQYMHKRLDVAFSNWEDIGDKSLIPDMRPDDEMFKLISFYVMSRLII